MSIEKMTTCATFKRIGVSIIVRSDTAYQFVAKQVIELQKKKHKGIRNAMFSIESRRYVGNKFKLSAWIKENILENCTNLESSFR